MLIPAGHLADKHGSVYRILVPDMGTREIAVAFFKAKDVALHLPGLLQQADLFPMNLKPVNVRRNSTP